MIYEVDYENETNLVSVIVSHPMSEELSQTSMVFVNDLTGAILKVVPIPTWIDVSSILCNTSLDTAVMIPFFVLTGQREYSLLRVVFHHPSDT